MQKDIERSIPMQPDYSDITSRISEPPSFYTGDGVPRYGSFMPKSVGDENYDRLLLLVELRCAACKATFKVARCPDAYITQPASREELVEFRCNVSVEPGDVPIHKDPSRRHGECPGSWDYPESLRVVEVWKDVAFDQNGREVQDDGFTPGIDFDPREFMATQGTKLSNQSYVHTMIKQRLDDTDAEYQR